MGIDLYGGLELVFSFQQVFVQDVELSQPQVVIDVLRFNLYDGFVLLNRQLQHFL